MGFQHVLLYTHILMGFLLSACSSLPCSLLHGAGWPCCAPQTALSFGFSNGEVLESRGESRGEELVCFFSDSSLLWYYVSLKPCYLALHGFQLWLAPLTVFSPIALSALGVVAALTGAGFWAHWYSWLLLKAAHTSVN